MGILDFEAYWLEYQQGMTTGYYDDNGDYHPAEEIWLPLGRVNASPQPGPQTITLPDGHTDTFSFSIHIHNPRCREFHHGDKIRLTNPYGEKYVLTVKSFVRYQTEYRIQA